MCVLSECLFCFVLSSVVWYLELLCVICVVHALYIFFFKQKTAYEMRISDWSSDVCSSDLLGTSFADEGMPGVDMVVPDVTWIAGRRKKLLGIVLTHAHADHLGAISHLWDELQCPIWATGFAASVLRRKLAEKGMEEEVPEIGRAHV